MATRDVVAGTAVSRRRFVNMAGGAAAAVALAAVPGCGGGDGDDAEVIIVGAGVAGMAAALQLKAAGRKAIVLEARQRPGGRIFCDNAFPVPYDFGAQLFQQTVPVGSDPAVTRNPLFDIARRNGVQVDPTLVQGILFGADGVPLTPEQAAAFAEGTLAMNAALEEAGRRAQAGTAPDLSLQAATAPLAGMPYVEDAIRALAGERGLAAGELSSEDLYNYSKWTSVPFGLPSTDNWFVRNGMGNFIAGFASGLDIRYGEAVRAIDRRGDGVTVHGPAIGWRARAVIVTASMGVLQSGRIAFTDALPAAHLDAIAHLRMGAVGKVGFAFDRDVFGGLDSTTLVARMSPPGSDSYIATFAKFYGTNMVYVVMGGPACRRAEQQAEQGLIDVARDTVATLFGADALAHVTRTACHSWLADPWAVGAYTNALPGHVAARVQLQQPIARKLYFAGEALSVNGGASMHGAWLSGQEAAADWLAGR